MTVEGEECLSDLEAVPPWDLILRMVSDFHLSSLYQFLPLSLWQNPRQK